MSIRTILFDLDGTLIDTNELIIESFKHTLKEHLEEDYSREEILPFIGPPLQESLGKVKPDEVEAMVETYRKHNLENHDLYVKSYDGVFETLQELHDKGYKMAIVTTKIRKTAMKGLELTQLDQFFDVVIGLDDIEHAKPDPEPVLKGMNALGGEPETTIMIGDNSHDIHAGQNAGTKTAAVAWSAKGKSFMESLNPDYMLGHISDLLEIVEE
ncbi:pyrophosphatase PpaX [Aquisalibacillus elongatus]|uniref:Pyrophosphatase PpaX n=1 Tax=Aquisalibacillus elongatus TaxID=485577 RepID=A0A3N5B9I0_9BACI|nr:pyrophosphatase PpaX [Aquisalibacillus elongatus]RPF54386.1 pyrophosphatase PpaX [Aquisalibacillus elongatus]